MAHPAKAFAARGGVAQRRDLLEAGFTGRHIAGMVASGAIVRVRIGWYLLPSAPVEVVEAVRVGGRLTCISAARYWGLWAPAGHLLHIEVPANASRFRSRADATVRFGPPDAARVRLHTAERPGAVSSAVADFEECLRALAFCVPNDLAVAVFDSALHLGRLARREEISRIVGGRRGERLQAQCAGLAESGIETLIRLQLVRNGIVPRLQVEVLPGVRVDVLVDGWLVVEADGSEHHSGPEAFERDRVRDAILNASGFRVLHFSYRQVMHDLPSVLSTIILVLRQGRPR